MQRVIVGLATIMLLVPVYAGAANSEKDAELAERLRQCARVEGKDARIECLQSLANDALREDSVGSDIEAAPVSVARADAEPNRAPDRAVTVESTKEQIKGTLRDCRKSHSGGYLFYLEDGQIWKQADNRYKRLSKCNWPVTIVRDIFGYKMFMNDDSYVRVRRIK